MSGSTGEAKSTSVTFIVRAARTADGRLAGVVERVRTGEKHRFDDPSAIGRLIDRMIDEEACGPEQGAGSRDP